MESKTVRSICFECHARCGVLLEVQGGKLVDIKGDKDHPFSRGYICPKGNAVKEIIYHPERITRPLLRVGEKCSGRFEPVSWNKALDIISERLLEIREKWGAEAFSFGAGTVRGLHPHLNRFLALYGSPNFFSPINMSGGPIVMGNAMTCGMVLIGPDYGQSRCIVLWAHNPEQSFPGLSMHDIRKGLGEGAKLIVVDPRGTRLAQKADYWLQIRPGTDVAMALCWIHVIIEKGLYDKAFVAKWTHGFDSLREHVKPFTPERCAQITWTPAKDIEAAAIAFAQTGPACIQPGNGALCQANDAFDVNRALAILVAITGNLEIPGGHPNYQAPNGNRQCVGPDFDPLPMLPKEQAQKRLGLDRYPIYGMFPLPIPPEVVWTAILEEKPYPVKAVGLFANNSLCSYANSQEVKKALSTVDFLFCADYFHTPTTQLADVILPPAHWTERDDIEEILMKNRIFCQPKAVEPVFECKSEKQILTDLAARMGLEGYWKTVEESLDYRLEPIGMSYEEFKKIGQYETPVIYKSYEKNGFLTPSGKVELCAEYLEPMGIPALPVFREPGESPESTPDLWREYPLILTTGGRNVVYYHSAHRNIPSLRKRSPDPELQIHPQTANELGIQDGEWIFLETPRGKVEIKARFFEHIHPKVVHAPHGYWYGAEDGWRKLNINQVTDNRNVCPVTGSVPTKAMLCRVKQMN
jgi:anaerobic selenocysteine-containing dehydrogenase